MQKRFFRGDENKSIVTNPSASRSARLWYIMYLYPGVTLEEDGELAVGLVTSVLAINLSELLVQVPVDIPLRAHPPLLEVLQMANLLKLLLQPRVQVDTDAPFLRDLRNLPSLGDSLLDRGDELITFIHGEVALVRPHHHGVPTFVTGDVGQEPGRRSRGRRQTRQRSR